MNITDRSIVIYANQNSIVTSNAVIAAIKYASVIIRGRRSVQNINGSLSLILILFYAFFVQGVSDVLIEERKLQKELNVRTVRILPVLIVWVEIIMFSVGRRISGCLLYTSPSPRDLSTSRMPSSA